MISFRKSALWLVDHSTVLVVPLYVQCHERDRPSRQVLLIRNGSDDCSQRWSCLVLITRSRPFPDDVQRNGESRYLDCRRYAHTGKYVQ
jgi:hypothetical protein